MQYPGLVISDLTDVVQVLLLSEFQDPQLAAIVSTCTKVGADVGANDPGLL